MFFMPMHTLRLITYFLNFTLLPLPRGEGNIRLLHKSSEEEAQYLNLPSLLKTYFALLVFP